MANSALALAGDPDRGIPGLTQTQLLVLWQVISSHLEGGNEFQVPSGAIAKVIRTDPANVRRALSALCDRGYIAPIDDLAPRPGRPRRYILDPSVAYHGDWGDSGQFRRSCEVKFKKARASFWLARGGTQFKAPAVRRRGRQ
jgi:hypothetical protein